MPLHQFMVQKLVKQMAIVCIYAYCLTDVNLVEPYESYEASCFPSGFKQVVIYINILLYFKFSKYIHIAALYRVIFT